ncbi:hypothetical protein KUTeg_009866 [Tegillarca granosa]|uniref:DNA polymerase delta subunit 4 n=1 Tax=Tegillarca granosa TaxID=220873 RepID=A0ABQ9FA35_TEGGR|nr:hypothetical protein KUTeg_009866 [Tegillarca granosa]
MLSSTNCERDLAIAMSANKLITDWFSKVKHVPKGGKQLAGPKPSTSSAGASNNDLEILKQFDLALEYGPCIGITRLERWERAKQHGMNPPPEHLFRAFGNIYEIDSWIPFYRENIFIGNTVFIGNNSFTQLFLSVTVDSGYLSDIE